jgi:hypothetical protein
MFPLAYATRAYALDVSDRVSDILFDQVQTQYPVLYGGTILLATAAAVASGHWSEPLSVVGSQIEVSVDPDRVPKIQVESVPYRTVLDGVLNSMRGPSAPAETVYNGNSQRRSWQTPRSHPLTMLTLRG